MKKRELFLHNEVNPEEVLSHQIDVYHGLQNQARSLLRILSAILAVSVTLLSAVLSGFLRTEIEVQSFRYYYESTVSGSNEVQTLVALFIVFLLGVSVIVAGFLMAILGLNNIVSVMASGGIKPYLPSDKKTQFELVHSPGQSKNALDGILKLNNQAISDMNQNLKKAYRDLGYSMVGLFYGGLCLTAVYFVRTRVIAFVSLGIAGLIIVAMVTEILSINLSPSQQKRVKDQAEWLEEHFFIISKTKQLLLVGSPINFVLLTVVYLLQGPLLIIIIILVIVAMFILTYQPVLRGDDE